MIPLRSLLKLERFPYVNYFFIILNVAVFIYFYHASSLFYLDYGVVPSKLGVPNSIIPFYEKVYPFFTYMFIHAGVFHLLFNILFLYIFGGAVEARLGHGLYFFVYIVFGLIAAMVQVFMMPSLAAPFVGASGAIAGLMGAYIVFFPLSKIRTLIIILLADIYAFVVIGVWFAVQVGLTYYDRNLDGGVAWWAHLGGFAAGLLFALVMRLKGAFAK